jgi:hypothetical protein
VKNGVQYRTPAWFANTEAGPVITGAGWVNTTTDLVVSRVQLYRLDSVALTVTVPCPQQAQVTVILEVFWPLVIVPPTTVHKKETGGVKVPPSVAI